MRRELWELPDTIGDATIEFLIETYGGKLVVIESREGDPIVFWKGQPVWVEVTP